MDNYINGINDLSQMVCDWKESTFVAKLLVKGQLVNGLYEVLDSSKVEEYNIFDYVSKENKKQYICISGYCPSKGVTRRNNAVSPKEPFDELMTSFCNSSRFDGGFEIYSDGCNNGKRMRCCIILLFDKAI